MSLAQPQHPDSRPSPPNLTFSSNNPFRNRAASPASNGHTSPFEAPPRPVSRNPFLDTSPNNDPKPFGGSPDKMAFSQNETAGRPALTGNAADLFDNLTLNDRPFGSNEMRAPARSNTDRQPPPYSSVAESGRSENVPPRHRPSRSQEEALRARKPGAKPRPAGELDIFADPTESSSSRRRVRRNSDSSVMSKASRKLLDPEEEKKRSERRRRERRHRERDAKDGKTRKPDRKLDIIDKLDVTSIYGTGLFHHDGPFDACNPHRNKQGSRRPPPMQAFPKDSLNNVLGGGGPLNKRPDHATFLGNNDGDAFKDYSAGVQGKNGFEPYDNGAVRPGAHRQDSNIMNATSKVEPIHGEETMGLGTSTFLEGAPASRTAMQRREIESTSPTESGGLGRKKSVAQRIKGITSSRREYGPSGRITSPEGTYNQRSPDYTPGGTKIHESNPFFNEFSRGDDKPKESITIVEPDRVGRARAPSSPRRGFAGIERRTTNDGMAGEAPKVGGGFMSRVKSLKGGPRKARADKMES